MKHAFNTDYQGLAHAWAYADNTYTGHCYGNRMYCEGDTIYSYGSHFAIATKIRNKKGDVQCILFNSDTYSPTTTKQQGAVRRAVSHITSFEVTSVPTANTWNGTIEKTDHKANIAKMLDEVEYLASAAAKARSRSEFYLEAARDKVKHINDYMTFFKARYRMNKAQKVMMTGEFDLGLVRESDALKLAKLERANRKRFKAQEAREKAAREKEAEALAKWYKDESTRIHLQYDQFDHLKLVEAGLVVTTQNIVMTNDEAVGFYKLLQSGSMNQGDTLTIDKQDFTVRSIDSEEVQIGCHRFKLAECLAFGAKL